MPCYMQQWLNQTPHVIARDVIKPLLLNLSHYLHFLELMATKSQIEETRQNLN